jgi:hypothetical protein
MRRNLGRTLRLVKVQAKVIEFIIWLQFSSLELAVDDEPFLCDSGIV